MSNYKQIPENTFGETPAAMYLCRKLNENKNSVALRSAGRRISGTASQVRQLIAAYEQYMLEPKVLANCLRLMREEISSEPKPKENVFEDQLRRNIQIGFIKQGIRLAAVARKAEHVMTAPEKKSCDQLFVDLGGLDHTTEYYFRDSESGLQYKAGDLYTTQHPFSDTKHVTNIVNVPVLKEVNTITPELLHLRSNRRCLRLGKAHAKIN